MYQQSIIQQIIKNTWLIIFSLVYISGSQPFWKKCNVFRHLRKRESHRCWAPLFLQVSKYIAFFHRRFLVFRKGVATERHGNPPIPVQETRSTAGDGFEIEETSAGFRRLGNPKNSHTQSYTWWRGE